MHAYKQNVYLCPGICLSVPKFLFDWNKLKIPSHLVSLTWYKRLLAAAVQSSPLLKVFIWYV